MVCADGRGRCQSGSAWALGAWEDRLPMPDSPVTSPAPLPLPAGRTGSLPHPCHSGRVPLGDVSGMPFPW